MTEVRRPPAWLMIAAGMLVTLDVVVLARLAFGLILPFMRQDLGLTYQQAGNLGTASAVGYLCLVMLAGGAAARWGGRLTVLFGVGLTMIGFTGLSLASHYPVLLALMALLGFGTAFAYTPVISLLSGWFPRRRGAVIGMTNSGVGLGVLGSGALIPYLNHALGSAGWRATWAIFAGISALTLTAAFAFLRSPPQAAPGVGTARSRSDHSDVFRNRHVITVGLLYGVVGLTYIAQSIFMYSFALESGVPALTAGRLAAMLGLLSVFASPTWGWISDRYGRGRALLVAASLATVGTIIPVIWPALPGFALHYFILGCTMSGLFTSVLAASTESVKPHQAPLAVSYVTLFFALGQIIGPALAGLMIEQGGGFRAAFGFNSGVMAVGIYLGWRLSIMKR